MPDERTTTFDRLIRAGHLELGDGYRTKQSEHGKPGLPILRVAEVLDGRIAPEFKDFVSDAYRRSMGSKISCAGDVVLTTKGTVGRVAMIPVESPECVYSPQVCFFRTQKNGSLVNRYLYYWFKSEQFWSQARPLKGQTDMADYINLADIRAMRITLPAESEQRGIAAVLGALDDKITVNDRIASSTLALLKAYFTASMKSAYRKIRLDEIIDLRYGKALKETARTPGTVPVYGSNGISGWHQSSLVNGPGIIVGRKGANAGSISWSEGPFWVIDTAFYVEPTCTDVSHEFLFYLLDDVGLRSIVGDSAIPGLNREIALSCEGLLPHADAIAQFTLKARALLPLRAHVASESRSLAELRDTLLPKLISGEIRVRDAERAVEEAT